MNHVDFTSLIAFKSVYFPSSWNCISGYHRHLSSTQLQQLDCLIYTLCRKLSPYANRTVYSFPCCPQYQLIHMAHKPLNELMFPFLAFSHYCSTSLNSILQLYWTVCISLNTSFSMLKTGPPLLHFIIWITLTSPTGFNLHACVYNFLQKILAPTKLWCDHI